MKLSGLMVLPLVLGLSTMTVACNPGGGGEADEQLETEPTEVEPLEGEEEEDEEDEDDD